MASFIQDYSPETIAYLLSKKATYGHTCHRFALEFNLPDEVVLAIGFYNAEEFAYLTDFLQHTESFVRSFYFCEETRYKALRSTFDIASPSLRYRIIALSSFNVARVYDYLTSLADPAKVASIK